MSRNKEDDNKDVDFEFTDPPTLPEEDDSSPEMVVFRDRKGFNDFFAAYFKETTEYNEIMEFLDQNQIPAIVLYNPDPNFSNDQFKPLHYIYHVNSYFGEVLGVKIITKRLAGKAFEDIVCEADRKKVFVVMEDKEASVSGKGKKFVQYHKTEQNKGKKFVVRNDDSASKKKQYIDGRRKNELMILDLSFRLYDQEETEVVTCSRVVINESGFKRIIAFFIPKSI
jgi:hypothetical protein